MSARTDAITPTAHSAPSKGPRHLLLLGAGRAHLEVLKQLAKSPVAGVQITLVAPNSQFWHAATLPDFIAGHYRPEDCTLPLEPLVQRSGVHWIRAKVVALQAEARMVELDNGRTLHFDWLSIDTGPVQNRERIEQMLPGAREHALFLRPLDNFATLWPQVCAMAALRPLRVAVVGGGKSGIEAAMAVQYRLPTAAVTLLSGASPAGSALAQDVQMRLLRALKERRITVLQDHALSIQADCITLGCGATLACDITLLATGATAPGWVTKSGLALDTQGFPAVDNAQRSTNHPAVFAPGDISHRSGLPLARNLMQAVQGQEPQATPPERARLHIIGLGNRQAVLSWGNFQAQGRWVWWLKQWLDRRYLAELGKA